MIMSNNIINFCTLNVNGMQMKDKQRRLLQWIKNQNCSIVFLQETHFNNESKCFIEEQSDYQCFCSHGNNSSRGVAILIRNQLDYQIISQFIDTEGRIILLNINIKDTIFTLVCLYAPNCKTTKNNFFKKVNTFLKDHGIGIPMIAGDFNETLKEIDRRSNSSKTKYQTVNSLKTLLKTNDLIDIWRELNSNKRQFTWRRKDKSQGSRIDYILVNKNFKSRINWDALKVEIREITMTFGKIKAKETRELTRTLEKTLEAKLACSDTADIDNKILNNEIDKLEKELEQIYEQKAKGAQIRSREKWVEFGEKNNAYFLGLKKKRQIKKSITKLLDDEGNIITNQKDILDKIKYYYKKLYTSTNPDKQNLNDYIYRTKLESKVNQEDLNVCDGQLSVEECTEAIFKMKLNKSPGIDGLTVEFYRTFWESIKYLIVFILNKCHEDRQLSFSQRTSVLTLLFKKR